MELDLGRGVYDARRAAALAGVPISTLHYWARTGIYIPSVSPGPRTRLWSWADLLALRAIDFFRSGKGPSEPERVSVRRIRDAVNQLERRGFAREQLSGLLAVSFSGALFITPDDDVTIRADQSGQGVLPRVLELVRPYGAGPDLLTPRPRLRIIPGKLHGEPHILDTRITSAAIYALHKSGYTSRQIRRFYPEAQPGPIQEAIDLEGSLGQRAA